MAPLPQHETMRRQLSQEVAIYVRELIISGRVRKGSFLRIESISKAMDISSTPVREGLLMLQIEGFVKLSPRRGFMVVGFTRQDVRDIFWAQAMLAGELAARAAKFITDDECAQIKELIAAHKSAIEAGDEPQYTRLGHQFHRTINRAAKSPRLAVLLGTMTKQLPNSFYGKMEGQLMGALDYHPRIFTAILEGNAKIARAVMSEHIVRGGEVLVAHLEEKGIWADGTEESEALVVPLPRKAPGRSRR